MSLARALYADADIYLLDDPLSAVDTRVSRHIFKEAIENYLKGKCVVLATHRVEYLKRFTRVYNVHEKHVTEREADKERADQQEQPKKAQ